MINFMASKLAKLSDEDLYCICDEVDRELDRRSGKWWPKGRKRSTYMSDQVRGRRSDYRRRLAA